MRNGFVPVTLRRCEQVNSRAVKVVTSWTHGCDEAPTSTRAIVRPPRRPSDILPIAMNLPAIFIAVTLTIAVSVPVSGPSIATAKVGRDGQPAAEQARVITVAEFAKELRSHKGRPVILHFWATWCVPCLTELPFLDRAAKRLSGQGVDFLPVSLDSPTQLSAQHVGALLNQRVRDPHWSPILKVGDIDAFMTSIDPHWEGAIPAFFAFDSDTRMRRTHLGNISQSELDALAEWVTPAREK